MDWLDTIKDILSIVSTIILIYVGLSGLQTWKRQLKGNVEYDHARELLSAVYKTRDAIRYVRNPFMSSGEHVAALKESDDPPPEIDFRDPELREQAQGLAYEKRWKKINSAVTELDLAAFEAEVLWGTQVRQALRPLRICIADLNWGLNAYFRMKSKPYDAKRDEKIDNIIYGLDELLSEDSIETIKNPFSKQIVEAIYEIEDFIRPKLDL